MTNDSYISNIKGDCFFDSLLGVNVIPSKLEGGKCNLS